VLTVNVAEVAPAATVTEAGTVAAFVLLLESATARPPVGAALPSVTVPVAEAPPVTVLGEIDSAFGMAAHTLNEPVAVLPLAVALMETNRLEATGFVEVEKSALLEPEGIVTLVNKGCADEASLVVKETTVSTGAAPFKVTVPVVVPPPYKLPGFKLTLAGTTGLTVNTASEL
jgi:hypothetical protein